MFYKHVLIAQVCQNQYHRDAVICAHSASPHVAIFKSQKHGSYALVITM